MFDEFRWLLEFGEVQKCVIQPKTHKCNSAFSVLYFLLVYIFIISFSIRFFSPKDAYVHRVDLGESFPTHILLQNLASIQPITSRLKFLTQGERRFLTQGETYVQKKLPHLGCYFREPTVFTPDALSMPTSDQARSRLYHNLVPPRSSNCVV